MAGGFILGFIKNGTIQKNIEKTTVLGQPLGHNTVYDFLFHHSLSAEPRFFFQGFGYKRDPLSLQLRQSPSEHFFKSRIYVIDGAVQVKNINGVRQEKDLSIGLPERNPLSTETIAATEKLIAGFWGLVPFNELSVLPEDAEWNSVTDDDLEAAGETEIYDLTWTDTAYDGSLVFNKWRMFVDPADNLPQRTEFYQKLAADAEYTLDSAMVVEYLSDGEMEAVIREASF